MARKEFSPTVKRNAYDRAMKAGGVCQWNQGCNIRLDKDKRNFHFDHKKTLAEGGKSTLENCQLLCHVHHAYKTGTEDIPRIRKADRQRNKDVGAVAPKQKIRSRNNLARKSRKPKSLSHLSRFSPQVRAHIGDTT